MSETQPLWYEFRGAIYAGDFQYTENMLAQNPELISLENGLGETVLHFLAVENDLEGVAWLFAKGALLDVKNKFGDPVIFEVASLAYKELLLWFKRHGADFNVKGGDGESLLEHLIELENMIDSGDMPGFEKNDMVEWLSKIIQT